MKGCLLVAGLTALLLALVEGSNHQDKGIDAFNIAEEELFQDNVEEDEDDLDDDDDIEEIGQSSLLSMLKLSGRQSVCDGKAKGSCKKKGGSCVTEPFKDSCVALHGSSGKLKKQACKSKDCQCCLPPPSCAGKIKKSCSKHGGSCVLKPFKANCKGGTLDKKSCKGKHCMCCIPGPTSATKPVTIKETTPAPTTPGPVTGKEASPEPTTPNPFNITLPTFNPGNVTLPTFNPGNVTLPTFNPGNVTLPTFNPGNITLPTFNPGNVTLPTFNPGNVTLPTFWPGNVTLSTFNHGNITLPTFNPGNVTLPTFNPGNVTLPTFNPGNVTLSTFNPGNVTLPTFNPGNVTLPTFNPGNVTLPTFNPGNVTLPTFNTGNVTLPTFNPVNVTLSTFNPGNVTLPTFNPGNVTLPTFNPVNVTLSTFNPGNVTLPTFNPGNVTLPTFNPGNVTLPTFWPGNVTLPTFNPVNVTLSTFNPRNVTLPTVNPVIITLPTQKATTTFKPIIITDPTPKPTTTPKPITIQETTPEPTTTPKPVTKPPVLAPCPSPFKLLGEECIFVHEDKAEALDWDESRQRCLSMGGDLAQPEDMVDFVEHIKTNHPNAISTIWLGATDREVEQEWKWVSGAPVPPAMWSPWPGNQPSGDGNCMEIHYWPHTDFYLNDWYCHNKGHFACEFDRTQQAKIIAKYSASQDNIWDDTQCSNAGNFLGKSLAECLMQCEVTPGCTAINHRDGPNPDCVLRACELPIPAPAWGYADYKGYSLITKPCVAPFKLRGSECFYVHEDKSESLNWDESRQRCQSMGGDLAQPKDMVDFVEHIKANHPNAKSTIWLGATDREVEQDWKWVSGDPVPPAMWSPWPDNQPSGDGNCMEIHYWPHTDFYLNDWWCHEKGHFACEFDMMP